MLLTRDVRVSAGTGVWLGGGVLLMWLSARLYDFNSDILGGFAMIWALVGGLCWSVPGRLAPGRHGIWSLIRIALRPAAAVAFCAALLAFSRALHPIFGPKDVAELIAAVRAGRDGSAHSRFEVTPEELAQARARFTAEYKVVSRDWELTHVSWLAVRFSNGAEYTFAAHDRRDSQGRWIVRLW